MSNAFIINIAVGFVWIILGVITLFAGFEKLPEKAQAIYSSILKNKYWVGIGIVLILRGLLVTSGFS